MAGLSDPSPQNAIRLHGEPVTWEKVGLGGGPMAATHELGKHGEQLAVDYLRAAGLKILERNWSCPEGEIDILARDGPVLVVVEVKTRSSRSHGSAFEAVTAAKLARLRSLAARWLKGQSEWFSLIRVDVVALERFAGEFSIRHDKGVS
jgi:putative endonuclease